jgi:molybdate transport system ATP-binding protein
VQTGSLADVSARPRSRYVADLVGVNLLAGTGGDGAIITATGGRIVPADPAHGPALAVIQPHAVALYRSPPGGSPRNVWPATVTDIDRHGDRVRVRLDGEVPLVAEITPAALDALALQPGDAIWATVKATEITTYPA